jgi:Peptidase family M13
LAADIEWDTIFTGLNVKDFGDIVLESPEYFTKLSGIVAASEIASIKSYLKFHVLSSAAPYLSEAFVEEDFNFYKKTLNGVETNEPRWKRVLGTSRLRQAKSHHAFVTLCPSCTLRSISPPKPRRLHSIWCNTSSSRSRKRSRLQHGWRK